MIRRAIAILALLVVVSCSMPERYAGEKCPREGGIGGTGECTTDLMSLAIETHDDGTL